MTDVERMILICVARADLIACQGIAVAAWIARAAAIACAAWIVARLWRWR